MAFHLACPLRVMWNLHTAQLTVIALTCHFLPFKCAVAAAPPPPPPQPVWLLTVCCIIVWSCCNCCTYLPFRFFFLFVYICCFAFIVFHFVCRHFDACFKFSSTLRVFCYLKHRNQIPHNTAQRQLILRARNVHLPSKTTRRWRQRFISSRIRNAFQCHSVFIWH